VRIGFTSIYSYRPHVEHVFFLAQLARQEGHQPFYLTCDAGLSTCYTREFRPHSSAAWECLKCTIGGLRSFPAGPYASIRSLVDRSAPQPEAALEWADSSVCSLLRTERSEDKNTAEFDALRHRLARAAAESFQATCEWIERCSLDALVLFNGRREATRGVLEAARFKAIPFMSVERTWFGDGLQLIPQDNCVACAEVDRLTRQFIDRPLSHVQAHRIGRLLASRFVRKNVLEWRAYNLAAVATPWPAASVGPKVLFLPSSRYESEGHPDNANGWSVPTLAFDTLMQDIGAMPGSCVLRCHPVWGQKIGIADGRYAEGMYSGWTRERGIHCIPSTATASTHDLMEQADVIVTNGGSSGFEAALLGKPVIGVSPSHYNDAGFQVRFYGPDERANLAELFRLGSREIARRALRSAHILNFRFYQYVNEIKAVTTTRYVYDPDAPARKFVDALRSGQLQPDDPTFATDTLAEDRVLDLIEARQWETLWSYREDELNGLARRTLHRRAWLRPIEVIRDRQPRGDL
jgi:hypothetical protein